MGQGGSWLQCIARALEGKQSEFWQKCPSVQHAEVRRPQDITQSPHRTLKKKNQKESERIHVSRSLAVELEQESDL